MKTNKIKKLIKWPSHVNASLNSLERKQRDLEELLKANFNMLNEINLKLTEKIDSTNIELKNNINQNEKKLSLIKEYMDLSNLKYVNHELINLYYDAKKTNILLCGFYAGDNIGDELMLQTLLDYFLKFNNIKITVMLDYNDKYNILKNRRKNIQYIHNPKSVYDFPIIVNKFDKIVFGGGALIDDYGYNYNNPFNINLSKILIELSKTFLESNKQVYWIGLSSGSTLINNMFIKNLQYIVNDKNAKIYLRDTNSLKVIRNSNVNVASLNIINDIILSNVNLNLKIPKKQKKLELRIGIVFICNDDLFESNLRILQKLIEYLKQKNQKYKITLIPFYDYVHNDKNHLNKLKMMINNSNIYVAKFFTEMNEILNIINDVDYIISMRYHASLLAMIRNKNLLTICLNKHLHYPNKMNYIYQKYAIDNNLIKYDELNNGKTLNNAFDELFKNKTKKFDEKYLKISKEEITKIISDITNKNI